MEADQIKAMIGLPILQIFPEIECLGQQKLQAACDRWLQTPIAKEFAVSSLDVVDVGKLWLSWQSKLTHEVQPDEEYYFPLDQLLEFIVDTEVAEADRETARARIRNARKQSPVAYRRFRITLGPKLPLFITCPHCRNVSQTQFTAYRNQRIDFDPETVECPACRGPFTIDGDSLHFEPGT